MGGGRRGLIGGGVACEHGRVQSQKGAWLHIKEAWPIPKALLMPTGLCNGERWVGGGGCLHDRGVAYTRGGRGLHEWA